MSRRFKIDKKLLSVLIRLLKWGKIIAKFTAIGTTVSGAITTLSGATTSGVALSAAGATTYAATKGLPSQGYEKTKHIPPGRVDKQANLLRHAEISRKQGLKNQSGSLATKGKMPAGNMAYIAKPAPARGTSMSMLTRKKT